jgi:transcriptional antiterminator
MLTHRCRQILNKIIDAKRPLLIKELAGNFQVSARAIKYDLDLIRLWLQEQNNPNVWLESKPNRGIWIKGDVTSMGRLACELASQSPVTIFNQNERILYITLQLLVAESYVTINSIAEKISVSRNTIVNDLSEVEEFINRWKISLERKVHYGFRIVAPEIEKRLVLEYIVQRFLCEGDMYHLVQSLMRDEKVSGRIGQLISSLLLEYQDIEFIFQTVKHVAKQAQDKADLRYAERVIVGLFIRLCVVVKRIKANHTLSQADYNPSTEGDYPLISSLQTECRALAEHLAIQITDSEIQYIGMQWMDAFDRELGWPVVPQPPLNVTELTTQLIDGVSRAAGVAFQGDADLIDNLLAHLKDRLVKRKHGVLEPNPLVAETIRNYNQMFRYVKDTCDKIFGCYNIYLMDADIAYIVLHFQAAYERRCGQKKYQALVVCSTGRGNARLLKVRLENEIKNLHVVACCSVLEIDKALENHQVDLIISVLPIEISVTTVVISAIPTERDFKAIQQTIKNMNVEKSAGTGADLLRTDSCFLNSLTAMRFSFPARDLPLMESFSQEIINQGFQIVAVVTTEFKQYLTETAAVGLSIHILLMVNRLAFESSYTDFGANSQDEFVYPAAVRERLRELLYKYYPGIPDGEIFAILHYFSQ